MLWVSDFDGSDPAREYNTHRSAFWRVVRAVAAGIDPGGAVSDEWPCSLCWSNLYKVAPFAGGNPTGVICRVQRPWAIDLLRQEIDAFAPRRVLVLSGMSWFAPFAETLGLSLSGGESALTEGVACQAGRTWVIVGHPQGKDERGIATAALNAFQASGLPPAARSTPVNLERRVALPPSPRAATSKLPQSQPPRTRRPSPPELRGGRSAGRGALYPNPKPVPRPHGNVTGLAACTWRGQKIYRVLVNGRETLLCAVVFGGTGPAVFYENRDAANRAARHHIGNWDGYRPDGSNNATRSNPGPPVPL